MPAPFVIPTLEAQVIASMAVWRLGHLYCLELPEALHEEQHP